MNMTSSSYLLKSTRPSQTRHNGFVHNGHLGPTELHQHVARLALMGIGAKSRWVDYSGGRLHALDLRGRGGLPPMVLLHGFSASGATQYGGMARHLRTRVKRLVIPDLPGHGSSSLPDELDPAMLQEAVRVVMDSIVGEPAVIFASSMAGSFAVRFAAEDPEAVLGLMLCSPAGAPLSLAERDSLARAFTIGSHRDALDFVDRLFAKPHPFRHLYAWGVRQRFGRPHLVRLLERLGDQRPLAPHDLATLRMPVYLLWGTADRVLPASHLSFFKAHLPPGSVIDTPSSLGHAPFLDCAPGVADKLIGFAARVDRARP